MTNFLSRTLAVLVVLLALETTAFAKPTYKYVDRNGRIVFVDSKDAIPPEYRDKAREVDMAPDNGGTSVANGIRDRVDDDFRKLKEEEARKKEQQEKGQPGMTGGLFGAPCEPEPSAASNLENFWREHRTLSLIAIAALSVLIVKGIRALGGKHLGRLAKWSIPLLLVLGLSAWGARRLSQWKKFSATGCVDSALPSLPSSLLPSPLPSSSVAPVSTNR